MVSGLESELYGPECLDCIRARMERLVRLRTLGEEARAEFSQILDQFTQNVEPGTSPVELTRALYHKLSQWKPQQGDFWPHKRRMNDFALGLQGELRVRIRMARDRCGAALRIALAGACIDFLHTNETAAMGEIDRLMRKPLVVDHSSQLRALLRGGCKVLYLSDGAGEVVLDHLLIRTLARCEVIFVVNCPDAGLSCSGQDADYCNLRHSAQVLSNGCQGPHTVLPYANARFEQAYRAADLIIAKGQSNLEALHGAHDPRIFHLLRVRCKTVGRHFGLRVGDEVIMNPDRQLGSLKSGKSRSTR